MTDIDIDIDIETDEGFMLQERIGIVIDGYEPSVVISALTTELALAIAMSAKGDETKTRALHKLCNAALGRLIKAVLENVPQ